MAYKYGSALVPGAYHYDATPTLGGVSLSGAALLTGITAAGSMSSGASLMGGEALLAGIAAGGSMGGLIVLGSLSGTRRKSFPVRTNKQTATR